MAHSIRKIKHKKSDSRKKQWLAPLRVFFFFFFFLNIFFLLFFPFTWNFQEGGNLDSRLVIFPLIGDMQVTGI